MNKFQRIGVFVALASAAPSVAEAAELPATPDDYQQVLAQLTPGDVMVLAPGNYVRMTIDGLHGTPDAWITIRGPSDGEPAVITSEACCNTVQLYDSSYVAIENLTIDVQGLAVDGINAKSSISHHIRIEGNTLQGFPAGGQQIVGINTKSTAYAWTIRGNTILQPGTGMYLGDSNGSAPFIDGRIERNLVVDPVGYCMQIKHQNEYEAPAGLTPGPHRTVIAHNVFVKDDTQSPDGARPNLLVGGFPDAGPGAEDVYDIYGNFIFYNPNESLIQATGRVSVHDNVLVGTGSGGTALALTSHQGHDVRLANVYNNTIYGVGTGVSLSGGPATSAVVGNLIFADQAIGGTFNVDAGNLTAPTAEAGNYVADPSSTLGAMDFYPLAGATVDAALDLSSFADDEAYDADFNGLPKGDFTFRGAYAGEGDNPGCPLDASIDCEPPGDDDGGDDGGDDGSDDDGGETSGGDDQGDGSAGADETSGSPSTSAAEGGSGDAGDLGDGTGSAGATGDDDAGGCACTASETGMPPGAAWLLLLLVGIRPRVKLTAWR